MPVNIYDCIMYMAAGILTKSEGSKGSGGSTPVLWERGGIVGALHQGSGGTDPYFGVTEEAPQYFGVAQEPTRISG